MAEFAILLGALDFRPRMTMRKLLNRGWLTLLAVLFLPATLAAQQAPPPELRHIEAFIERGMKDWAIPGLAVAVVKDDQLVWARGFGVRRLGDPTPVDENTHLHVASYPTACPYAALGLLVYVEKYY